MNNAKMWLVVKPTVGIPLFLGAVAVGSFAVHVMVLSKTNWYNQYMVGAPMAATASAEMLVPNAEAAQASFTTGGQDVLIMMPDGTMTHATLAAPGVVASLN
jgi:light-harvesting protein B-800-850 alpha chain